MWNIGLLVLPIIFPKTTVHVDSLTLNGLAAGISGGRVHLKS